MASNTGRRTVVVIHGPNLNFLGRREPAVYGSTTLEEIDAELVAAGERVNLVVETFQSNHEGAIVEKIQQALDRCGGLIINPAAYTHTSVAIRDALLLLEVPIIEVHISNVSAREPFRHESLIADVVTARLAGFGARGYRMALEALDDIIGAT